LGLRRSAAGNLVLKTKKPCASIA